MRQRQADRRSQRRTASSSTPSVDLHIDTLLLEGFAPAQWSRIAAAVERSLAQLIAEGGLPPAWAAGGTVGNLEAGVFDVPRHATAEAIGESIAGRIYSAAQRGGRDG